MEFLVRNFDSTNPDPELDRSGCRKRGMVDSTRPDGHEWGDREGLPRFVVLRCPGVTEADMAPYDGMRKMWWDSLNYEITGQNANQGWYDIRVWEENASASLNRITGAKATRIEGFLTRWGCGRINFGDNEILFRFDLWDAVRSVEFWDVTAAQLAQCTFERISYTAGVGTIRVTVPVEVPPMFIMSKVADRRGVFTSVNHPEYVFTIERGAIVAAFRADVKEKAQQHFMYQRYRFTQAVVDAAEAAGGVLDITRANLLAAIIDAMAA